MNYPVWLLDVFGGGTLIALIAVVHVYVSHFAVGGGLFLVITEMKGLRENSPAILEYTRKHARFFLLLTMVFGGLTGVAIWFTIALLSPSGTSSLIHTFVFAWAIEWVFFLGEIVALLLYYYTFNKISSRNHLILGWIYFGCAWLSLFVINGVIDYMLTPGEWLNNNNFWSGFFNPTFWPALFFRTFLALMIAGLFGFLTSVNIKDEAMRHKMVRYCGLWLMAPLVLLLGSALWYKAALPPAQQEMIFSASPEMKPFLTCFVFISPLLFGGGLLSAVLRPQAVRRSMAWILFLLGFLYMGSFEFMREGGRRPYIIHDYMYSTSILKADLPEVQKKGVLQTARWVKNREVTRENRLAAGAELSTILCLPCHSTGGPLNDMLPIARRFTPQGMEAFISGMGTANPYMPPFAGTREEAVVLAEYLTTGLVPGFIPALPPAIAPLTVAPLPFDPETSEYILLAGPTIGNFLSSEPEKSGIDMSYGSPVLRAQLIFRDTSPSVILDDATVSYRMQTGKGMIEGVLAAQDGYFEAVLAEMPTPLQPFQPFFIAELQAEVKGKVVAVTQAKIGFSTEIGCRNCHGGRWRQDGRGGLSRATAATILASHDKRSNTSLSVDFAEGKTVVCSSCHGDFSRGTESKAGLLGLSTAMHGFHAGFVADSEGDSCGLCHSTSDTGVSHSFDGIHKQLDLSCSNCHGGLVDHAVSLLKQEAETGQAAKLLSYLQDKGEMTIDYVNPRSAWVMEPDCLTCHVEFQPPETDTAFNAWTEGEEGLFHNRMGEAGAVLCSSCHGQPHSLYPAANRYGKEIGALQPMQYQKSPYPLAADKGCAVCHTVEMEFDMHHPGSLATFRNRE
ncbi:MAG: cytochrome ubiquinol oxidase subunit I [Thermodesulfobacteriota bacterium]|nr:cytochrome ubiquinol oxidase subunit I [Thermodesulfobacteriota bacterium]